MDDFIEPGTQRRTNIKIEIEIETLKKTSEMYFSYCIESKDFYMRFLTAQLKRILIKDS